MPETSTSVKGSCSFLSQDTNALQIAYFKIGGEAKRTGGYLDLAASNMLEIALLQSTGATP